MRRKLPKRKSLLQLFSMVLILFFFMGCAANAPVKPTVIARPTSAETEESRPDGLSDDEFATLNSLEMVDDYPLYTMHYYGGYNHRANASGEGEGLLQVAQSNMMIADKTGLWGCSLFVTFADKDNMLFGRNFDWDLSPAVLLFTDPPDGYASVSVVDIHYLDFGGERSTTVIDLPLKERMSLLDAPFLPFDGMNERGLVVGMAAVPPGEMQSDPGKETIDSLMVIRKVLDQASTVDEALDILGSYNIDMVGTPLHYLIADASGRSVLVEFYQGEIVVIPNDAPWHLATNFLRASVGESAKGMSRRYDNIFNHLTETGGNIASKEAFYLLKDVSQPTTQWSVVYGMSTGEVSVVMGRQYEEVYTFDLIFFEE